MRYEGEGVEVCSQDWPFMIIQGLQTTCIACLGLSYVSKLRFPLTHGHQDYSSPIYVTVPTPLSPPLPSPPPTQGYVPTSYTQLRSAANRLWTKLLELKREVSAQQSRGWIGLGTKGKGGRRQLMFTLEMEEDSLVGACLAFKWIDPDHLKVDCELVKRHSPTFPTPRLSSPHILPTHTCSFPSPFLPSSPLPSPPLPCRYCRRSFMWNCQLLQHLSWSHTLRITRE